MESLGGSESALVFLAEALARRGHQVWIFTPTHHPGEHFGVEYQPLERLEPTFCLVRFDAFIAQRDPAPFRGSIPSPARVLWAEDVLVQSYEDSVRPVLPVLDQVVLVSHWHRRQWVDRIPELLPFTTSVRNSIDLQMIPPPSAREHPPRFVHLSRPERGLRELLDLWPLIRELAPDAELQVARYESIYERLHPGLAQLHVELDRRVERTAGCRWLGHLSKPQLYDLLVGSTALLYPGEFLETSCIAAIEAQACGVPLVASARGGLISRSGTMGVRRTPTRS